MLRLNFCTLLLLAIAAISCSDANLYRDINDISEAKERWNENGSSNYRMEVERSCFCPPPMRFSAVVENNEVVEIIDTQTGEPSEQTAGHSTVDDLFTWLERVAQEEPKTLDLKFHPTLGYPTLIDYNQSDQIADEELLLKISNLKLE